MHTLLQRLISVRLCMRLPVFVSMSVSVSVSMSVSVSVSASVLKLQLLNRTRYDARVLGGYIQTSYHGNLVTVLFRLVTFVKS